MLHARGQGRILMFEAVKRCTEATLDNQRLPHPSHIFLCVVGAPPRRELWVTAEFPPSLQPCQPSIILV